MGLLEVIFVVLVMLKLFGLIAITWMEVFIPVFMMIPLFIIIVLIKARQ